MEQVHRRRCDKPPLTGFYPALHNEGGVSKNQEVHQEPRTRDLLTYLLHYVVELECCCVYLVHPKFDLYILSNKSRQDRFLAVCVK